MPHWFPQSRLAVSLLFLANGFIAGSWAAKIPDFKMRLGIDESELGILLLAFGVGSLIAMPVIGAIIARHGSRGVTMVMALAQLAALPMLTLAPNPVLAALALVVIGGLIGGMDVAMNANAVSVERVLGRAMMSSCHGFWSLGGMSGAALGGVMIAHAGAVAHAAAATALAAVTVLVALTMVMEDRPPRKTRGEEAAQVRRFGLMPILIGLVALASMIPEGAILDWGALYLRGERNVDVAISGFAFAGFSVTMAALRFAGDALRNRFGAVRTLQMSALLAGFGLALASMAPNAILAIAGFATAGIGIANMVPIAFSAAGNLPGYPAGVAISTVTVFGYSGILFAPSLIGFIAEHTGLGPIFLGLALFFLPVFFAARIGASADGIRHD